MSAIIWGIAVIAVLVAVLGIVAVWRLRKTGFRHETDYRAFTYMGLVWIIIGSGFMFLNNLAFNGLFSMGVIFLVLGLANRDKWKNAKPMTQRQKMAWYAVLAIAVILIAGLYIWMP